MTSRALLIAALFALLGTAPTVSDYGTAASSSGAASSVSMHSGSAPYTQCPSCSIVAFYFNKAGTSPTLSGTWTTICTNTSGGFGGAYTRAVLSSDNSSTFAVLSSSTAYSLSVYLVQNGAGVDASSCAGASGSSSPLSVSLSASATHSGDLGLELGGYYGGGTTVGIPSYTPCTSYSNDSTANNGGTATRSQGVADHLGSLSSGTNSCAPSWSETGTISNNYGEAALVLIYSAAANIYQPVQVVGDLFWPLY